MKHTSLKKLFLAATIVATATKMHAQPNHVPNPSFEDTITCPESIMQFDGICANWQSTGGTPDYYNACSRDYLNVNINKRVGVPYNAMGHQRAASGKAYAGLMPYNYSDHFEYIETTILPLTPGITYEVSMSVSLGDSSILGTNNLGIFFYNEGYTSVSVPAWSSFKWVIPQVHYSNYGLITNTTDWVRLTQTFVADSAYDHIIIGGFNDTSLSYDTTEARPTMDSRWAYYLIDSVVVKPVYPTNINITNAASRVSVYPNPTKGKFILTAETYADKSFDITIVSPIGQIVYKQQVIPLSGKITHEIDMDAVSTGIYLVRLTDNQGNSNITKIFVE